MIFVYRAAYIQFVDEIVLQPGTKQYENNWTDVTFEDHVRNVKYF